MLERLCVTHIALIDRLDIEIPRGFTVLTGETGAGKSIVIDAVNLVLGGRADRDLIQTGQDKASVEALFVIEEKALAEALEARGVELEEGGELVLSRELSAAGRNTCRVNGRMGGVSLLRDASELLIDIHGQHEHQTLLRASSHLEFLDQFGKERIEPIKDALLAQIKAWRSTQKMLRGNWGDEAERERRADALSMQVREIDKAALQDGEEELLLEERAVLANAETLQNAFGEAFFALEGPEDGDGALAGVKWAGKRLEAVTALSANYESLRQRLEEAYYGLEDIAIEIRQLRDDATFDPYRYEEVEHRLETIDKLKRKYGGSIAEILAFRSQAAKELDDLEQWRAFAEEGGKKLRALEDELYAQSQELSEARRDAAEALANALLRELADLGMDKAQFAVALAPLPEQTPGMAFSANGLDEAEMLLSTNPGEPLKPLQKVASGGELSRIMLAFKSVAAGAGGCETLIFDEIDTGISGRIAAVVGEKMRAIARKHQVICVTHSPQIAAMADAHYLIEKQDMNGKTTTYIRLLDEEGHIQEVARIVSGQDASSQAVAHARDLVEKARQKA